MRQMLTITRAAKPLLPLHMSALKYALLLGMLQKPAANSLRCGLRRASKMLQKSA